LAIVLSVPLRYTDSDYPFGIFKLFLKNEMENTIANIRILDVVRLVHDMGTLFLSSS
jgi:hypothetical protein